jgi:hypothetical protein
MLLQAFHGGPFVEVFATTGGKLPPICKTVGNVKREYDKTLKGFLLEVEGGRENRVCLPPDEKESMGLLQPNLILQLFVPHGKAINLDLAISDQSKTRRLLSFSSSHRDFKQTSPTMARIPFDVVRRGVWLNLCLDVRSLLQVPRTTGGVTRAALPPPARPRERGRTSAIALSCLVQPPRAACPARTPAAPRRARTAPRRWHSSRPRDFRTAA